MRSYKVKYYFLDYKEEGIPFTMPIHSRTEVIRLANKISRELGQCEVKRVIEVDNIIDIDNNYLEIYINGYGRKIKW